jgi:hypothetical protein
MFTRPPPCNHKPLETAMTDITEVSAATPADDVRACDKAVLFAVLAAAGIHRVTVEYDGSGDSGQIENIEAWNVGNQKIPLPCDLTIPASEHPEHPRAERKLEEAIEALAWEYLYDLYWGWENNDGAFGTFVFDVPARTIALEHNERYTEVNTTSHEF